MSPSRLALGLILLAAAVWAQPRPGRISGSVFDSQTGRPVVGATIAIDGNTSAQNRTDSEGRFLIPLSPGAYTLRYSAQNYTDVQVAGIVVREGESTEASTVMTNKSFVTSVDVVEKATAVGATAEAALVERKLAPVVSDAISHEELSAGTSSDAAGALEKVTGISVVGEGFVYVRGLGERYSATMLNSAMIPTTEPEKRVVPLDLFPTGMIESINVLKSYTPDLPAEFSGGLVQMTTIEFPAKRILKFSSKAGFNSATTFNRFLKSPGGGLDFFGFDDGTRALPSTIPAERLFAGNFTRSQFQEFGRAFSDNWEPVPMDSARPAADWSVVGGGTFGRLGLVGAISFSNSLQNHSELQRYFRQGGSGPIVFTDYPDFRESSQTARLGGVFNAALRLTPTQKLVFRNTFTHEAENTAREFSGYDGGLDSEVSSQRLRWVERSLFSTSAEGDHSMPGFHNSVLRWQLTWSRSTRDEPDLREVLRGKLPNGTYIFSAVGSSGIRFFSDMEDHIYEPQMDFSVPFYRGSISALWKTGFRATIRHRDFQARRFRYIPQSGALDLMLPSNQLFAADNIRPDGFEIVEFTRGTDAYSADQRVYAGYSMVDLGLGGRWRVVAGARFESADIGVTTVDNRVPNAKPTVAGLQNTDPTPAANLIYALSGHQNLRLSYSRTLSRPDFRELSPFDFNDVLGGYVTQGNANLKRAVIQNWDARWEMFPGGNQLLAASFFAKTFQNPIEATILAANDLRQTFVNAQGARNIGVELELRRNLSALNRKLREFSVASNFTFVDSQVDIGAENVSVATEISRPLLGQSRYIFNSIAEWARPSWRSNARIYANFVSRRISQVGTFRLPDVYEEGNTVLDFVYQYSLGRKQTEDSKWLLRFEAENLLNAEHRWTQGDLLQRSYRLGRSYQVGVTYSVF